MLRSRIDTSANGTSTHLDVYGFIPDVLSPNPLFGLGLNNFSVYYEFVTGRTNFGPHSFYVATLVETGVVGTALFVAFLVYLFRRLGRLRGDRPRARARARVRPLAWGLTAALVGTIAANAFYLTMSFYYFFVFAMLALAAPVVFARPPREGRRPDDVVSARRRRRRRAASSATPSRRVRAPGSRSRSSRRRRSATSGSPTATGSSATCAGGRGSRCCCRRSCSRYARAARRAARDADLVHAHWLPSALAALATGKPYVVQLWGTDVELARARAVALRGRCCGARGS